MIKYVIAPIVEGHGEAQSLPILLENWFRYRRYRNVALPVDGPIRAICKHALTVSLDRNRALGIEHYVQIAMIGRPDAILVLLDADDDRCPGSLASGLLGRARAVLPPDFPVSVVVAKREYEAWFIAALFSWSFRRDLADNGFNLAKDPVRAHLDSETIADCKSYIAKRLGLIKYDPIIHQPAITRHLTFTRAMIRRSGSYRKLLKELHSLLVQARRRRGAKR